MKNEIINETEKRFLEEALAFPQVYQTYLDLAESQKNTACLKQLRRTKLTDILQYAATNVPFYQQFQLNTNDIQEQPYKILQSLPLISKDVIRANYDDYISDNIEPDKCYYTETTGSTGEPFQIVHDKHHEIERAASLLRRLRTWGVPWNCRMLHAAGRSDTWQEEVLPIYGSMRYGRFGVPGSSLDLNREDIRKAAEFQPDVIMSHGTEMLLLAQAFNNAGFALRPKVLMSYGEVLGENTRAYLTEAFQATVYDVYGTQEFGCIAWQNQFGEYLIDNERVIVEIIDERGNPLPDGEYGEFVITGIVNRTMPLIRYRTGDYGRISASERSYSGHALPTLDILDGRNPGFIVTPDGTMLNPYTLKRIVEKHPIAQFQIVQNHCENITLNVLPLDGFSEERLHAQVAELVEPYGCHVYVCRCELKDLLGPGGKVRMFQCSQPQPFRLPA